MLSVTVLCPNNRRVVIKFEAGTTMFQVLDEACKKQGFVTENYGLKHQNKFVDLSLPFRLTGLPQNCTLEMVENCQNDKEEVEIALQMPDGNRMTKKIPSDATLLDLLLDFERESGLKLLEPEGENMHPVCQYLNNEYVGTLSLASTTLKSMGIRGKALFRFAFRQISDEQMSKINDNVERNHVKQRKLEETFEKKLQENKMHEQKKEEEAALINQLAADVSTPPSVVDAPTSSTSAPPTSNFAERQAKLNALQRMLAEVDRSIQENIDLTWDFDDRHRVAKPPPSNEQNDNMMDFSNFKFPEETKGLDLRSLQKNSSSDAVSGNKPIEPCDRRAISYRMDDKLNIGVIEAPSDEFFDVTTNDVRLQHKRLQEQTAADNQRALLPVAVIREREMENKKRAWKVSVIRIQFPDGVILQGTFRSLEPMSSVYQFVKENLANDKITFKLCSPPNFVYDKFEENLIQLELAPRATLIFRVRLRDAPFIDGQFLKREILQSLKSQAEAELTAHECLLLNEPYVPYRPPTVQAERQPQPAAADASFYQNRNPSPPPGATNRSVMPKWLKDTLPK